MRVLGSHPLEQILSSTLVDNEIRPYSHLSIPDISDRCTGGLGRWYCRWGKCWHRSEGRGCQRGVNFPFAEDTVNSWEW